MGPLSPLQNQRDKSTRNLWFGGHYPPGIVSGVGRTLDQPSESHNTGKRTNRLHICARAVFFWSTLISSGSPLLLLVHLFYFWSTSSTSGSLFYFWFTDTSGSLILLVHYDISGSVLYFWFTLMLLVHSYTSGSLASI